MHLKAYDGIGNKAILVRSKSFEAGVVISQ